MADPKSLLLINAGALGDFVLAVALLRRYRRALSQVRVSALCRNRIACYLSRWGVLKGWKSLEGSKFTTLFSADGQLPEAARQYLRSFDTIVSMLGDPAEVVSRRLRECVGGELFCIDPNLRPDTEQQGTHIVEQWVGDLRQQGMGIQRVGSSDHPDRDSTETGNSSAAQAQACGSLALERGTAHAARGCILIHPGSGGRAKCWPLENFEHLARRLLSAGRRVQFMIGPVELELHGENMRSRLSRIAPVIYEEDVCAAAEHVERASAFIGNDAGMTHLAAFLGIQTVAIFVATDCDVWRPVGDTVAIIQSTNAPDRDADLIAREIGESHEGRGRLRRG